MKQLVLISVMFLIFSLSVQGQTVTKDNVMNYVDKVEIYNDYDSYSEYKVFFTDGEFGFFFYNKENNEYSLWNPNAPIGETYNSRVRVIYLVWEDEH